MTTSTERTTRKGFTLADARAGAIVGTASAATVVAAMMSLRMGQFPLVLSWLAGG